jgi:hypothetical protein
VTNTRLLFDTSLDVSVDFVVRRRRPLSLASLLKDSDRYREPEDDDTVFVWPILESKLVLSAEIS